MLSFPIRRRWHVIALDTLIVCLRTCKELLAIVNELFILRSVFCLLSHCVILGGLMRLNRLIFRPPELQTHVNIIVRIFHEVALVFHEVQTHLLLDQLGI